MCDCSDNCYACCGEKEESDAKMFCKNCGKELSYKEKFCPACGAKVEKTAPVEAQAPVQPAAPKKQKEKLRAVIIAVLALLIVCGGIAALVHFDVVKLPFFSSEGNTTGEADSRAEVGQETSQMAGGAIVPDDTEPTEQAAHPVFPDNLIITNEQGQELSLYMERSEVEAILGQPIRTNEQEGDELGIPGYMVTEAVYSRDSTNLIILYLDQATVSISLTADSGTNGNWRLKNGLTIGLPANLESLQQVGNINIAANSPTSLEDLAELPTDRFDLISLYRIENETAYALDAQQFVSWVESSKSSEKEEAAFRELAQPYNRAAMGAEFENGKCSSIQIIDLCIFFWEG